jgi:hypothetical protein
LGKQYVVAGWTRFFVVDAIHLGLVVFLFPRRGIFSATRFLNACLLLFIYYATILDIYGESVYMVDKTTLTTIVLITTYFYLILMRKNVSH